MGYALGANPSYDLCPPMLPSPLSLYGRGAGGEGILITGPRCPPLWMAIRLPYKFQITWMLPSSMVPCRTRCLVSGFPGFGCSMTTGFSNFGNTFSPGEPRRISGVLAAG